MPQTLNRRTLAVFASLVAVAGVIAWFRISTSAPHAEPYRDPRAPNDIQTELTPEKAEQVALAEVEKREGWTGIVEPGGREGSYMYFIIKRQSGPTDDWRYVTVRVSDGAIEYKIRHDPVK